MSKEKDEDGSREFPEIQFTLQQALHRTLKMDILMDIVVAEEVVEDYPVAWVKIRGSQDPQYLKEILPVYTEFREDIDEANKITNLKKKKLALEAATLKLHTSTVTMAIIEWDERFFGDKLTREKALEVFLNDSYSVIYNQIAHAMQQREDFLPSVSIQPENG
ncbi:slt family transglycosylase [Colwellia phage 9A]|uniref:Slt family transglycosylase n=1 Tax=Colwellia phage 9A TaxID=765765 RepID=I3UME1_9CAUD|nr:slt family transglycosylase [Colwellia phage 9A]AFK66656.1 slt family transglycosylase [Colwellia phage 9A]